LISLSDNSSFSLFNSSISLFASFICSSYSFNFDVNVFIFSLSLFSVSILIISLLAPFSLNSFIWLIKFIFFSFNVSISPCKLEILVSDSFLMLLFSVFSLFI